MSMRLGGLAAGVLLLAPLATGGAQVRFERAGFRLTSIGERVAVAGRVVDARRRPVPSGRIRWRISDPTIASVTAQGVVVSRRAGNTRLWAVAGSDSASALIVVDQWAAKFEFAPQVVRLDAVGAKAPLRISVRDAQGHPINDVTRRSATCRTLNDRIAVLADNGDVTARANGSTWVRCTDRGIADSVRIEVRQRPARVLIADKGSFTNPKVVGEVFTLRLAAQDRSGDEIRDPQISWASLNPTIVSIDPLSGATRAVGAGTARVVAQVGDVTDTLTIPVSPSLGLAVPPNSDTATTVDIAVVRVPTLKVEGVYASEGEQSVVRFSARDASGNEVPNAEVLLRSTDTSVFAVLPGHRVQSKRAGNAYVVGKFGNAIDSAQIVVRSVRATEGGGNTTAAGRPANAFVRPTLPLDSLRAQRDSARARRSRAAGQPHHPATDRALHCDRRRRRPDVVFLQRLDRRREAFRRRLRRRRRHRAVQVAATGRRLPHGRPQAAERRDGERSQSRAAEHGAHVPGGGLFRRPTRLHPARDARG